MRISLEGPGTSTSEIVVFANRWRLFAGGLCSLVRNPSREYAWPMALPSPPIVASSPDVMGGTVVFAGTRVPIQTFLDYLEGGETIDDFLAGFPTVTRDQVVRFLEQATQHMMALAS